MVGATRICERDRGGAHLLEGLEPLAEDRPRGLIALEIDAPDLASAVVEVEVGLELLEVRLGCGRGLLLLRIAIRAGAGAGSGWAAAEAHRWGLAKVLGHVGPRSEQ